MLFFTLLIIISKKLLVIFITPPFDDLIDVSSSIFFIYVGFTITAFAFLTQYLTFPRSLFSDLSNMKENGYPRIMDIKLRDLDDYKKIVSYFFQLDYVSYSVLMFILFSIIQILILTSIHFELRLLSFMAIYLIWFLTFIYFVLRGYLIYRYVLKKTKSENEMIYERGNEYWDKKSRWKLIITESAISFILLIGLFIAFITNSGIALFLLLIFTLVLHLAWHLWITAYINPLTALLDLWTKLSKL